ncbi:hypothetical protein ZWY2020_006555 [Hordeum vulgare]|nr:hypothetical protein ZWY2020_006555 [Hordeum vulgare]
MRRTREKGPDPRETVARPRSRRARARGAFGRHGQPRPEERARGVGLSVATAGGHRPANHGLMRCDAGLQGNLLGGAWKPPARGKVPATTVRSGGADGHRTERRELRAAALGGND